MSGIALGSLVVLLILIGLRVPLAFAMGIVGAVGMALISNSNAALALVAQTFADVAFSANLAILPMFILMGNIVTRTGMSEDLYRAAYAMLGHRRGGLAMATVMACGGFSAICGSSLATAATMSKVALPPMRSFGYSNRLAAGSIAAGGTLGILIPPSIILVLYGTITETSIGKLFFAAIVPGLIGLLFYLFAVAMVTSVNPASGPPGERMPWRERFAAMRKVWGVALLFVIVMGGIYTGVFTPNESAGFGVAFAALLAVMGRKMSWSAAGAALRETVEVSAALFMVLIGALIFANFVNSAGIPGHLSTLVTTLSLEPFAVIVLILLLYLVLGCFLESISMVLLTVPIFLPIVTELGYDPIWFGIMVVVATEIGLITPPIGMNLFVIKSVFREVPTGDIVHGVLPFVGFDILRLALLAAVPALSLYIPSLM